MDPVPYCLAEKAGLAAPVDAGDDAEYLARFDWLKMQLKNMDAKIESIGQEESYREK